MSVRRVAAALVGSVVCWAVCGFVPQAAFAWDNTPAVAVYVTPYNASYVGDEAETPESPLAAEAAAGSGGNTAWGRAVPGALKVTTAISGGADPWSMSHAVARFADHFHLDNAALPSDTTGDFYFRFVLTGTMRILASDWESGATVAVGGSVLNQQQVGMLNFYRVGSTPTLYGLSGDGGSFPPNNIFANPDGSMKVYGTTTTVVDGYYVIQVNVPVVFAFRDMPINRDPELNDWLNWVQIELTSASFKAAVSDFSSTFAFAAQNPVVPDPEDAGLPAAGWTYGCASDEIALPAVTTVATSTGTGLAAVVADRGVMSGLTALTLDDFPGGLSAGNFAHGWFGLDVAGVAAGEMIGVGFTLPDDVGLGAVWWYHDGAAWQPLPLYDDDGDAFLALAVVDDGPGDLDPAPGAISLRGGITDAAPTPGLLQAFTAAWRGGGVDLAWQVSTAADPERLAVRAVRGAQAWPVAATWDGAGSGTARDASARLLAGGTVRYELTLDGQALAAREVVVPVPRRSLDLGAVAPNPCNPRATVAYTVVREQDVELAVFDLAGRRVATLVAARVAAGTHVARWDGRDDAGRAAPAGTYLVRLRGVAEVQTRKLSLVR